MAHVATTHILVRIVEDENGIPRQARYFGEMNDDDFAEWFTEQRRDLPKGWQMIHIPVAEILAGSKRVDLVKQMPIIIGSDGFVASWRWALRKEFLAI